MPILCHACILALAPFALGVEPKPTPPPQPLSSTPPALVGIWTGQNYSMEIHPDLTYRASGTPNMAQVDVTGRIRIVGHTITFTDTSGRFACPPSQAGEYTFTVSATTLTFKVLRDPCDGRRAPLSTNPLTRK